jgi:hypothetical protein
MCYFNVVWGKLFHKNWPHARKCDNVTCQGNECVCNYQYKWPCSLYTPILTQKDNTSEVSSKPNGNSTWEEKYQEETLLEQRYDTSVVFSSFTTWIYLCGSRYTALWLDISKPYIHVIFDFGKRWLFCVLKRRAIDKRAIWDFKFSWLQVWRWQPSGIQCCTLALKKTDISRVHTDSEMSVYFNENTHCYIPWFKSCPL